MTHGMKMTIAQAEKKVVYRVERSIDGGYLWSHIAAYDSPKLETCQELVERENLRENERLRIVHCLETPLMVYCGQKKER